jgi:hypothetical protein
MWTTKLRPPPLGDLDEAYLYTVPVDQRERQQADRILAFPAMGGVAGLAPVALRTGASKAYLEGRRAFANGSVLDEKDLLPKPTQGSRVRDMLGNVHKMFAGTPSAYFVEVEVPIANVPIVKTSGKQAEVTVVCRIMMRDRNGPPAYSFEGEVLVESPLSATPSWTGTRIRSLRVLRGRTVAPPPKEGAGQPGR